MSYLILGSNSFAGASFVHYLLHEGHHVAGISRSKQPPPALLAYGDHPALANFTFHQFDLNQHTDDITSMIKQKKPTVIVDFVGQGMVAESWKNPEQWYQTNIVSKVKLHDFLRNCDFLERYVRVSTPEVYGHSESRLTENSPFAPSTPYAVSHAAIDMSLLAYFRQYQFPVMLTRFANFYGPHQQLYRIIPRAIIYALIGERLPLHGGGVSKRAFIHGHDVATALDATLKKGKLGETYHFSAGEVISIADLVREICDLMQMDFDQFVNVVSDRPAKDTLYDMDFSRATQELEWQPKVCLHDGLTQTIAWVKRHIDVIKQLPLHYVHKA